MGLCAKQFDMNGDAKCQFYWLQKNLSLTARLQLLFNIVRFAVIAPALFSVMLIIPPFLCISSTVSSSGV